MLNRNGIEIHKKHKALLVAVIYLLHYLLDSLLCPADIIQCGFFEVALYQEHSMAQPSNIAMALGFLDLEVVSLPLLAMADKGKVRKTGQHLHMAWSLG